MADIEGGIRELISSQYKSVPKFAEAIGLPSQTVYSALRNGLSGASMATAMPIAEELGLDPFQLARGRIVIGRKLPYQIVDVPLVFMDIREGNSYEATPMGAHPIPDAIHKRYPQAYLLKVFCESANRALPVGAYALVEPCNSVGPPGDLYVMAIPSSGPAIMRGRALNNGLELVPDSTDPTYKPIIIDYSNPDAETPAIMGRIVWYTLPYDWRV